MQAKGEEYADTKSLPVFVDTRYQPGTFGWDTIYPRYEFKDGLWDTEDAAFRVDLPEGRYEVTCRFQSNDDKPHSIDLYANGDRVIKKLTVPGDGKAVEKKFAVEVTEGTLIQVIHAANRDYDSHWVWSGFTIQKISG